MKRDGILTCLIGGSLAFLVSFGGLGCLVTGFGLSGAGMVALALICGLFSLAGIVLSGRKQGGWLIWGILALGLFVLLCSRTGREQLHALLCHISVFYHRAYGWELPWRGSITRGSVACPLGLAGSAMAMLVSWTVVRRKDALAAVPAALLPLAACLVVTDTVPREGYLYILILGTLLLILTAGLRQNSQEQANTLALLAVIPTALALGLLFLAIPQEGYVNKVQVFYDRFLTWADKYPALMEQLRGDSSTGGDGQDPQVDLRNAGPLLRRQYPVMDVAAPVSGTMYLRSQDYDLYDGTGWTATPDRAEILFGGWQWLEEQGTVTVAAIREQDCFYVPYYSATGTNLMGGAAKIPQGTTAYGFALRTLPENWRDYLSDISLEVTTGVPDAGDRYLSLPEGTRIWAEELLETILPQQASLIASDKAGIIAAYVCGSAAYDTDSPRMPGNQKDFVRWFLTEGDRGYCIHFASATTVLLRAAGVPARYVTGYMFQAEAGVPVTVRADQAHAWVEYYEDRLGMWLVLESTPSTPEAPTMTILPQNPSESPQETTESTLPGATPPTDAPPTDNQEKPPANHNGMSTSGWQIPDWLKTLGAAVFWLTVAGTVLCCQRWLRLRLRRRNAGRGSHNRRALARWRELELLYRRLGQTPPEEMAALARKAKYSQHTLSHQELQTMDAGIREARGLCRKKPWHQRIIDQYIYGAY